MYRSCVAIAALVAIVALSGCGGAAKRVRMTNNLKQLGLAYHSCHDVNQKGPADWAEAQKFGASADVQQEIEAAGYTIVWGLKMSDAKNGTSNTLIAYPKDGATAGGTVLFLDGSVGQLTAAEVAAKLAGAATP